MAAVSSVLIWQAGDDEQGSKSPAFVLASPARAADAPSPPTSVQAAPAVLVDTGAWAHPDVMIKLREGEYRSITK